MKNKGVQEILKISALAIALICSASQIKADGVSVGSERHSLNVGVGERRSDGISIGSKRHSLNIGGGERKYKHIHHRHHEDGSTFRERHPYGREASRNVRQNI